MEILQIVGLGLVASVLSVVLKNHRPELSMQISIVTGIIIFLFLSTHIPTVFNLIRQITEKVNLDWFYMGTVIKIIGIAYITEFGAEVCRDAGENAIASKIEFAGKVLILILAAPIILALLNLLIEILP